MSTFYGGEQVATIFSLTRDTASFGDPGTVYTVPANRYAKVYVMLNRPPNATAMVFSPANTSVGAGADRTIPEVYDIIDAFTLTSFVMNSGNTIKSDGSFGVYNYQFLIKEYFKS